MTGSESGEAPATEPGQVQPDAVGPLGPSASPGQTRRSAPYLGRFAFFYLCLAGTLIAAIAGVVILALQPGRPTPPPWSSWRPNSSNVSKASQEIVDHVSQQYKLNATGDQLLAILPSAPEVTRDKDVSDVSTIAIRTSPTSQTFSRVFSAGNAYQDQLCGLGTFCSIASQKATPASERLVRREALEVALYTFKYLPQISTLIAYVPPAAGQQPSKLLLLERTDFPTELREPLSATLPLAQPPLPSDPDTVEAARIDQLTMPYQYSFEYEAIPTPPGSVALILAPAG
jgi:hypothetical protein